MTFFQIAPFLPVDEIFIVIALHLVLDGCLQVTDPFEGQLEVGLQALIGCLQTLNVHFLLAKRQSAN